MLSSVLIQFLDGLLLKYGCIVRMEVREGKELKWGEASVWSMSVTHTVPPTLCHGSQEEIL